MAWRIALSCPHTRLRRPTGGAHHLRIILLAKADFLIVGAQKCGTTTLHHHLVTHPDLFLPATKEVHFFEEDSRDWTDTD